MSTINDYIDYLLWKNKRYENEQNHINDIMTLNSMCFKGYTQESFDKAILDMHNNYETTVKNYDESFVKADKYAHHLLQTDNLIRKEMHECIGTDVMSEEAQKRWMTMDLNKAQMELNKLDENASDVLVLQIRIKVIENMLNRLTNK
jgi:hypothetical protein